MHGASVARWAFTVGVVFACGLGCAPPPEDEIDAQDSELSTTEVVEAGVALRTTARVNLRAGAGQDHDVVTVLEQNEALTTVTRSGGNGWVHVKTAAALARTT
ncbi:MAG: SH3 domain-containing protein, partial [Proteobacteria bacterium]